MSIVITGIWVAETDAIITFHWVSKEMAQGGGGEKIFSSVSQPLRIERSIYSILSNQRQK